MAITLTKFFWTMALTFVCFTVIQSECPSQQKINEVITKIGQDPHSKLPHSIRKIDLAKVKRCYNPIVNYITKKEANIFKLTIGEIVYQFFVSKFLKEKMILKCLLFYILTREFITKICYNTTRMTR